LKRSYSNEGSAEVAKNALREVMATCVKYIHFPVRLSYINSAVLISFLLKQAVASLLATILDHRHSFYAKYGFPKVNPITQCQSMSVWVMLAVDQSKYGDQTKVQTSDVERFSWGELLRRYFCSWSRMGVGDR
jgi:hypothetical protein